MQASEIERKIVGEKIWMNFTILNHFSYKNGIPSHDTFRRVFSLLDPKQFKICFSNWVQGLQNQLKDYVHIDGKTLRGSFDQATSAIRKKEADYLLALKGNHGDLYEEVQT